MQIAIKLQLTFLLACTLDLCQLKKHSGLKTDSNSIIFLHFLNDAHNSFGCLAIDFI